MSRPVPPADEPAAPSKRTRIYRDRRVVSLRIAPELHTQVLDLCDTLQTPINTYLVQLIEEDLRRRG